MKYTAKAFGWMIVLEAPDARRALSMAKEAAESASLFHSDITKVTRATPDEIAWYDGANR